MPSAHARRMALTALRFSDRACDRTTARCSASGTARRDARPPHGIRTTMGTPTPQRYRIFAALLTSWLKPVATKSLNCISPMGRRPASAAPMHAAEHGAFRERRVQDPIAELLEQRPQQQKRVAVLAAHVLAENKHARIGRKRVPNAVHHGFQKGHALLVEGRRILNCRAGASPIAAASRSSTSTRVRGRGSPPITPSPTVDGRARAQQ